MKIVIVLFFLCSLSLIHCSESSKKKRLNIFITKPRIPTKTFCFQSSKCFGFGFSLSWRFLLLVDYFNMYIVWLLCYSLYDYDYELIWSETLIDSTYYNQKETHQNLESNFIRKSEEMLAKKTQIGEYYLPEDLRSFLQNRTPMILNEKMVRKVEGTFLNERTVYFKDDSIYISKSSSMDPEKDPGCLRIHFFEVKSGAVTILAQQKDRTFEKHMIESGLGDQNQFNDEIRPACCVFCLCIMLSQCISAETLPIDELFFIFDRSTTKNEVFEEITKPYRNKMIFARYVCWGACCIGITFLVFPFTSYIAEIPLFEYLYNYIYGLICFIFGFMVGTTLSIVIGAILWSFYKPVVMVSLIAIGVVVALCFA